MRDSPPPFVVLTTIIAVIAGLFGLIGLLSPLTEGNSTEAVAFVVTFGVPALLSTAYTLACVNAPKNVGRRHSSKHTFARLCGYSIRDCGCTYTRRPPGASEVESESVWIRSEADARVTFRKSERGLKRCHRCGHHFHFTEAKTKGLTGAYQEKTCWPEEEPGVREEITEEIVEVETDA